MAGKAELDAATAALLQSIQDEVSKINALVANVQLAITEATNAISRLLGKVAAGSPDLQAEVDQINALKTTIDAAAAPIQAANDSLVSAIATFQVEGN